MDLGSVLTLVLLAFFLAAQPWSVLAAILLVTSRGGMNKELAFVAGWVSALAAVAVVTVLVYPAVPQTSTASKTQSAVEVAVGLALATWLAWRWRHPKQVGTSSEPAWMARLDGMPPVLAFGLGAFLPTYAVVVAAVSELLSSGLSQAALFLVALGWVLLASVGVASPLIVLMTRRDDAAEVYGRWRVWIIANSRPVLYLVGGLVCAVLVIKGLVGLLA